MQMGDKVSIFSDKAYRKNQGKYFEAVGNVVIISGKDTIYGEYASMDQEKMLVKIEGNVRIITKDMTLYGSHLEYNLVTGKAVVKNARILTPEFNLVASKLIRVNEKEYLTQEAEFSTCKDCAESWTVYGKTIRLLVDKEVQIRNGLMRIKGASVLYIPYISLPIVKRKTGMLFPEISSRVPEGISYEQPVFVDLGPDKDATISPMFWAKRGYGGNFQYRQRFRDLSWLELNGRTLNDSIYQPGKTNLEPSGDNFFRYYVDAESHQQWSPDLKSHFRYTGVRDLDTVRVDPVFIEPRTLSSDYGLQGHMDFRQDLFSISTEADYLRNQLYADPLKFDRSYVQVMPRVAVSSAPISLLQTKTPGFQHIAVGLDSSYTRFRQVDQDDTAQLRNADRISLRPYMMWQLFTWGPVAFKSRYTLDQQFYQFADHHEANLGKNAGLMQTEASFTMDKIFGLAFEEKVPVNMISKKELNALREKKEQGLAPIQKSEKVNTLIGELPEFESELSKDNIIQVRKSYRHAQEFKFIHHYITSDSIYGNNRFATQIKNPQDSKKQVVGWFDYEDALRRDENKYGGNATRLLMPPENTIEFQWNNSLVRKTPKPFSYLEDDKFLRDNFTYSKVGYFNVSQGYMLNQIPGQNDLRDHLTRLLVATGYSADKWNVNSQEAYFHMGDNIFNISATRRFEYLNIFSNYNYTSFQSSQLKTLMAGGQIRPTDTLGLGMVRNIDLNAHKDTLVMYSLDIMPNNNCWILSLNYRQSTNGSRYSFNIFFNFGDDNFDRFRNDYFGVKRL